MRTALTALFTEKILSPNSDEVGISLLEIDCDSFDQTYRVCDNNEDVVSNGDTYTAWAFELAFCDEVEGEVPSNTLVIDNTDPAIFEAIRQADPRDEITITYRFVAASDPDTNQLGREIVYKVADFDVTASSIVASLVLAVISTEQLPRHAWTPSFVPGLFGGRA